MDAAYLTIATLMPPDPSEPPNPLSPAEQRILTACLRSKTGEGPQEVGLLLADLAQEARDPADRP